MRKIIILLIVLLLGTVALPLFLETSFARAAITAKIESQLPGSQVELDRIEASWTGPFSLQGMKIRLGNSSIYIDKIKFQKPLWKAMFDSSFHGDFEGIATASTGEKGSVKGAFFIRGSSFSFQLDHFPTAILSTFRPDLAFFKDLLGEYLEGTIQKKKNTFHFNLKSEKSTLSVSGKEKDGMIFLDQPLILKRTVTKDEKFESILGTLITERLDSPVEVALHVDPHDFHLDMETGFSSLSIGHGMLTVSPFEMRAHDFVLQALSLIRKHSDPILRLESTPVVFSLKSGIFEMQRQDLLFDDTYHMAIWGSVDLHSNKLNLTAGLTEKLIFQSFGIEIPTGDIIQVPIRGTLDKPRIDTASAISKLEPIVAKKKNVVVQLLYSLFKKKGPQAEDPPAPAPIVTPSWEQNPS